MFHRRISSRKSDYLASRGFSQRTITEQARISTLGKTEIQNKDFGKIRGFSSSFNEQGANPDNLVTVTRIQLKDGNPTVENLVPQADFNLADFH